MHKHHDTNLEKPVPLMALTHKKSKQSPKDSAQSSHTNKKLVTTSTHLMKSTWRMYMWSEKVGSFMLRHT